MPRVSFSIPNACGLVCATTLPWAPRIFIRCCSARWTHLSRAASFATTSPHWCSNIPKVIYTAAHGGFSRESVPLGGGAAVFEHLVAEWSRTRPFELQTVTPAVLGDSAP